MQGGASRLFQRFEVARAELAPGVGDHTRSRLATSVWTAFWIARSVSLPGGPLLQIPCRGRVQSADALIGLGKLGGELLEAAEGGHLALGLVDVGGIG